MESATKGKAKRRHLSANACSDLGQSMDGSQPLTDPMAVPRSSKDPNRGLYPRTPTKRRRGDVETNQTGITDFFPVTDVVRVSPRKTATVNGLLQQNQDTDGQPLTPTKVKQEEDRAGQSLTPTTSCKAKQDLDVADKMASMSTPEKLQLSLEEDLEGAAAAFEEDVDYMEGITEDMFTDDEEFEREGLTPSKSNPNTPRLDRGAGCSTWGSPAGSASSQPGAATHRPVSKRLNMGVVFEDDDDDTVEPLPDPAFGLLGVRAGLQVPQGRLSDLPVEVLRQVFGKMPADDIYRNVQLVCKAWRDIVADPKFVPWKKLYYRYERKEPAAFKEVQAILAANYMNNEELSLVNMFRYMSEFKHSKRVDLQCVLKSVSTHRLYGQAVACITYLKSTTEKTRLRAAMSRVPIINGSPSPWCVMAVILLLADGVADVLSLVQLLQRSDCMLTPEGASEYLWAVATLLRAIRDKGETTACGRLLYNVYYVLQMMENSPVTVSTDNGSGPSNLRVTHEQQVIMNHNVQPGQVVKIMAFAGTGKTTTLVQFARMRPHLRFLYVAFNKSVQTHAQKSFPSNVHCKTIHSMAFGAVGRRFQNLKKLSGTVRPFSVSWVLPKGFGGFVNAKLVCGAIQNYCASADPLLTWYHVPDKHRNQRGESEYTSAITRQELARIANQIWSKMVALEPTKEAAYHMYHDGYLKLWQLQKPVLEGYDVIFIDEAQDCTPAIMDIMLNQPCGKILVGDPHQQIYSFRGAVNALYTVPHTHIYYLTQSFRFGPEIAFVGASILSVCKGVKRTLVGTLQKGNVCGTGHTAGEGVAILCRSNLSVFSEAVRLTEDPNHKIHIVGGVDNFGLKRIMDIWILLQPDDKRKKENLYIQDAFIRGFSRHQLGGFGGLKKYASNTEDHELEAKLEVVLRYQKNLPELVKRIYNRAEADPARADYILGTVHKAKGLEFDTVMVSDDFIKVQNPKDIKKVDKSMWDEWNLMYVAVTRARKNLTINPTIYIILNEVGEHFLRSELTSLAQQQHPSLTCCVRQCNNTLDAKCLLSMIKMPVKYSDYQVQEGPMCVVCVQSRVGPLAYLLEHPEKVWKQRQQRQREEEEANEDFDLFMGVDMMWAQL
ncbi:F-box DNA helicase 1 isoform X2 [Engraulis encrasicolus]|uniref:F-box DNA helicase 1 isoform X2 n=1 Tax=Engraulis encrasicolus TaxID=184585 RepID=UPI002FD68950